MDAETQVNDFVGITLLASILYRDKESMYDFAEIDADYNFGICEDIDIEALYIDEQMELFVKWHNKANEIYLVKREQLIGGLK